MDGLFLERKVFRRWGAERQVLVGIAVGRGSGVWKEGKVMEESGGVKTEKKREAFSEFGEATESSAWSQEILAQRESFR